MIAAREAIGLLLGDQGLEGGGRSCDDVGGDRVAHHDHTRAGAEHIAQLLDHRAALLGAALGRHVVDHNFAVDRLGVRVSLGRGDGVDQRPQIVDVDIVDREKRSVTLEIWCRSHAPDATTLVRC